MLTLKKDIDRNHNMLILGKSETRAAGQLQYFETISACEKFYGNNSTIASCFRAAKTIGVTDVFTVSFSTYTDLMNIVQLLQQYEFTYIAPVDILTSEYYNNPYRNNKRTYYLQYLMEQIDGKTDSTFLVTDKHASLYEDIDAFINDMSEIVFRFKNSFTKNSIRANCIFVDNNLERYKWANVILAAMLCISDIPEYPVYDNLGPAIFDIDSADTTDEQVYFKNNTLIPTSVENLLNLADRHLIKIVVINKILKYIARNMDFSEFIGKLYTPYQRTAIQKKLQQYLNLWNGWIIYRYTIDSITSKAFSDGTVHITMRYTVWPKGTTEAYTGEVVI